MNAKTARDIIRRLQDLERSMPTMRLGVITDTSPLSVALGGSDVPYTDVKAIAGIALAVDDVVSVARYGADLVILGKLGDGTNYTSTVVTADSYGAYLASNSGAASGWRKVALDTEEYDPNSRGSSGTYTVPATGRYLIAGCVGLDNNPAQCIASLYKNGSEFKRLEGHSDANTVAVSLSGTVVPDLTSGDTIELWCYSGASVTVLGGPVMTYMYVTRIS